MVPFVPHRCTALAAGIASCLVAVAAAPAYAGSYEQINRLSGAQGGAAFTRNTQAVAASDTGRYGVFQSYPYGPGEVAHTYARDIVSNTTTALTTWPERILGFDASEQLMLVTRPTSDGSQTIFSVRPVHGGAEKVVYTTSAADGLSDLTGAISGDGKTVVLGLDTVKVITVATRAVKSYTVPSPGIRAGSVSDDGTVIAGVSNGGGGFKIVKGVVTTFTDPAVVSGNGSTIVRYGRTQQYGAPDQVIVEKANGTGSKTFPLLGGGGEIGWVSADGAKVEISASGTDGATAELLTVATGKWSTFGGPFTASIDADLTGFTTQPRSVISRSGRYAVVGYGSPSTGQDALVDLTGGDLPGDQEPVSASSYFLNTPALGTCGADGTFSINFVQPETWIPAPKRADLSVSADGTSLYKGSSNQPTIPGDFGTFHFPIDVTYPAATKSITIAAKVVDGAGNTVTTTETTAPYCYGGTIG